MQQGKAFKDLLQRGLVTFKTMELVWSMKPRWMSPSAFLWIAGAMGKKKLEPIYKQHASRQRERIQGIARGANIDEHYLWFFSSSEIVMGINDYEVPLACGCTVLVPDPASMDTGHVTVARNFDFATFVMPYLRVRKNELAGYLKTMDITAAPLPGTFNGYNEAGVFIATNEAFPIAEGIRKPGLSASVIIQEALETCNSTQEVIDMFKKKPRGSCNIITIADKHKDIASLEYTSTELHELKPGKEERYLVATNHYLAPELAKIDLPVTAVFGKKAPRALRGTCINKTSRTRRETVKARLNQLQPKAITRDWLFELLKDHSANNSVGGMETICHHDPENISAASMVIDLETLDMWACFGLPCEHVHEHVGFSG